MKGKEMIKFFIFLHFLLFAYACQKNWLANGTNCYFFSHGVLTWVDAFTMCKILGGMLVEVNTNVETEFVDRKVVDLNRGRFWIGGHDSEEDHTFVWATSRLPVAITHFKPGQPDGSQDENCIQIYENGLWNDESCSHTYQFICEAESNEIPVVG